MNKMSSRITKWAQEKDPLVFERMKKMVVESSTDYSALMNKKKHELVYISRQGRGRSLPKSSHVALMKMLEQDMQDKINTKLIQMESYSPEEQTQICSNADIIIGGHGNGLTNALWMPKGGFVIEMFNAGACIFDYRWIASI